MAKQTHDLGVQKRLKNESVVEHARLLRKNAHKRQCLLIFIQDREADFRAKYGNGKYYPTTASTMKNVERVDLINPNPKAVPNPLAA